MDPILARPKLIGPHRDPGWRMEDEKKVTDFFTAQEDSAIIITRKTHTVTSFTYYPPPRLVVVFRLSYEEGNVMICSFITRNECIYVFLLHDGFGTTITFCHNLLLNLGLSWTDHKKRKRKMGTMMTKIVLIKTKQSKSKTKQANIAIKLQKQATNKTKFQVTQEHNKS